MSVATDVQLLVTRGIYYSQQYDTLSLDLKALKEMAFGATRLPKDPSMVYTDLHVHLHRDTNPRVMLAEAAKRVDIVAITGRSEEWVHNHDTLDTFLKKCRDEEIRGIDKLGENVLVAEVAGKPLYIVRGTEVYPQEMVGVVSVGGKLQQTYYHGKGDLKDAVADAKDNTAMWFFDHPFSIPAPIICFRYPTADEVKQRRDYFREYDAIMEVWNHQNIAHMYLSNEIAKAVAEKEGLVAIANSDTHFRVRDIGLSRTSFQRDLFDPSTEAKFLDSLRKAFSKENKDNLVIGSGFSSLWAFENYMVVPTLVPAYGKLAVKYNL